MPKYTPTKIEPIPNVAREIPCSPVTLKCRSPSSPIASQLMSPSSIALMKQQKLQHVTSKISKQVSPSRRMSPSTRFESPKRNQSSPSVKKLLQKVLRSPTSERKLKKSDSVTDSPSKRNFVARALFSPRKKHMEEDVNVPKLDMSTETDDCNTDCRTDLKTDVSYFPSMVDSDGSDSDDDQTGKSYMNCSDDEADEVVDDLIDTFGLDIPSKFTPRRKSNNLRKKRTVNRMDELLKEEEQSKQKQIERKASLQAFIKNRLANWKKEATDKKPTLPELESKIPDMFQALSDDHMSVADAIIKEWEMKQAQQQQQY